MVCRVVLLSCALLAACGGSSSPPAFGIPNRIVVAGLDFSGNTPQPDNVRIVQAFPGLAFANPIHLTHAPGEPDYLYVAEKGGRVRVFSNDPAATTSQIFLDISTLVRDSGEQGLLGLVFDPNFAINRYFYVYYSASTASPGPSTISRFTATSATSADAATEIELLRFNQPFSNHNAGMIEFGPDGKLYIGSGDGGSANDPQEVSQNLNSLLGKMLRINSDGTIPADNPFLGQGRGEIWAYGLRNPWRFSFDRNTGELWCADVGQGAREEINLVPRGGNMGWDFYEGTRVESIGLPFGQTVPPIFEYDHSVGASITGGHVYRGTQVPSLAGVYVYADFVVDRVWGLVYDGNQIVSNTDLGTISNPVSFGEDAAGEVYVVSMSGRIYKFEEIGGGGGGVTFPQTLSATGLFSNTAALTPTPGMIEYGVNARLWSDGARKRRWIALPGLARITFRPTDAWGFPIDTVLVKHFELETSPGVFRRLETRVLLNTNSGWEARTYRWNAAQTDADLLAGADSGTYTVQDGAGTRQQTWDFPSRAQCLQCHTAAAGRVLGVRTRQLNGDFDYGELTDNQLRAWNHVGLFGSDIGEASQYEAYADPMDDTQPVADRARAYLDVNCAMCHRPGGTAPVAVDLRYATPLAAMNAVDIPPSTGDLGLTGARIIAPNTKESSTLWERLRVTNSDRMPPLGSREVDPTALDLLGRWIDSGPN